MNTLASLRKVFNIDSLKCELLEDESKDQLGNIYWFNLSYDHNTGEAQTSIKWILIRLQKLMNTQVQKSFLF